MKVCDVRVVSGRGSRRDEDCDASPWVRGKEILIASEDEISCTIECKFKVFIVLGVATLADSCVDDNRVGVCDKRFQKGPAG